MTALPQGSSLRSGLCCPGPSSLNRPHAPHSPAHPAFTDTAYTRCPRCASTLQRLGDQRVDPCFHWPFCIDMSPSETPGFSSTACTQFFVDDAGLRLLGIVSAPPTPFTLRFSFRLANGDSYFRAFDDLVTRIVAGYHYVGNWVSSTPGLSPVGMPASIAATPRFL